MLTPVNGTTPMYVYTESLGKPFCLLTVSFTANSVRVGRSADSREVL